MVQTLNYASLLEQVLRTEAKLQPGLQPITIAAVCDQQTGHFLLVATGWENHQRLDSMLFHARLAEGKIVIETDQTEEGLTLALCDAGIPRQDILVAGRTVTHSIKLAA